VGARQYRGDARHGVPRALAVTAAILGVMLLGEPVTFGMMAGMACVAAGLGVANWQKRARFDFG